MVDSVQLLEESNGIIGNSTVSPVEWIESIKNFQNNKIIRNDYSPDLITIYIHALINGLLFDSFKLFTNDFNKKASYVEMIKKEILKTFKN